MESNKQMKLEEGTIPPKPLAPRITEPVITRPAMPDPDGTKGTVPPRPLAPRPQTSAPPKTKPQKS